MANRRRGNSGSNILRSVLTKFIHITSKPEKFLTNCPADCAEFKATTKQLYDYTKKHQLSPDLVKSSLPSLIIDKFEEEQIWQQIELQNTSLIARLAADVADICSKEEKSLWTAKSQNLESTALSKKNTLVKSTRKADKAGEKNIRHSESVVGETKNSGGVKNTLSRHSSKVADSFVDKSDDVNDSYESFEDSEADLNEIKSRLKQTASSEQQSESDDGLDFDFGDVGSAIFDKNIADGTSDVDDSDPDEGDGNEVGDSASAAVTPSSTSVVDDQFFKLAEMEEFLEQQDALERKKEAVNDNYNGGDDSDIDMFAELGSEDDNGDDDISDDDEDEDNVVISARKIKYNDYFDIDKKRKPGVTFKEPQVDGEDGDESSDGSDDVDQDERGDNMEENKTLPGKFRGRMSDQSKMSSFEKRQEKLREKILDMEDASISMKPWQLSGEVSADNRPENSLLEETVQFDRNTNLPPVITEETTKDLEAIILQRIKDKAWDDVERKVKPADLLPDYKKRVTLDQEKSKKSLSEIYEEEYIRQQQAEAEEKKDPNHEQIKNSLRELFIKLDALSNFHFTPRPAAPDVVIVSNQPSIAMEEVAPVSSSDAQLLAPEEIHEKKKGVTTGDTEKTTTDRKRERRKKKARRRAVNAAKEKVRSEKAGRGVAIVSSKKKATREVEKRSRGDKSIKVIKETKKQKLSSKAFFTQLQEEVKVQMGKRKSQNIDASSTPSSKKFKL